MRGERETGRDTVSTIDEAASAADDLGFVDPDVAPGAEPLVDASPGTATAAGGTCGVEAVSAPSREGTRDPLKHLSRRRI